MIDENSCEGNQEFVARAAGSKQALQFCKAPAMRDLEEKLRQGLGQEPGLVGGERKLLRRIQKEISYQALKRRLLSQCVLSPLQHGAAETEPGAAQSISQDCQNVEDSYHGRGDQAFRFKAKDAYSGHPGYQTAGEQCRTLLCNSQ